jgi:hypothetical protein
MRILVCGGRDYTDERRVFHELDTLHDGVNVTHVIVGGARGADQLGLQWAVSRAIPRTVVPADWERHGKSAGPIRNAKMLSKRPDLVVAFPGGKGTANMIQISRKAGVEVREIR